MPDIRVHNPSGPVYPTTPDYAHAIEIVAPGRILYTSGTMGLDVDGQPGGDLDEQLRLLWRNIRTILDAAGMTLDNIVRVTSYLTDRAQWRANQDARLAALGGRIVPTTAIVVQTLSDDWLVEIEVIAAA